MFVPTQYAIVLFFILLVQTGTLFVYTVIGLLKSNPLPFIMQPQMAQMMPYQCNSAGGQLGDLIQPNSIQQAPIRTTIVETNIFTTTTTVMSTIVSTLLLQLPVEQVQTAYQLRNPASTSLSTAIVSTTTDTASVTSTPSTTLASASSSNPTITIISATAQVSTLSELSTSTPSTSGSIPSQDSSSSTKTTTNTAAISSTTISAGRNGIVTEIISSTAPVPSGLALTTVNVTVQESTASMTSTQVPQATPP